MPSGYSGTPLVKKLGIKPGFSMLLKYRPANYFSLLEELPPDVAYRETDDGPTVDFIHFFVKDAGILVQEFPNLKSLLGKNGLMWVSWPKKAAKVVTDVDGNLVREVGLSNGLVDIKVCAVDEIWSGLKFVYRVNER